MGICQKIRNSRTTWTCYPSRRRSDSGCNSWKIDFDYEEFAWLYNRISAQELNDRIEWELAVYAALNQLEYALKISKSEFELYDGSGERRYFSFNSEQNAQRVFLKLLFPLNV